MGTQINNGLLRLDPVTIPGWIPQVIHPQNPHGGIPLSLFEQDVEGLLILIDPWQDPVSKSVVMAVDDFVGLHVNDGLTPVAGKTIEPGEETQRVRLFIPKGILIEGVNKIHYEVKRVGQSFPEKSDPLNVLFHTLGPGQPGHSTRTVQLPADVLANGVDKARAALGVQVGLDYANRRAHDLIQLSVGRATVDHTVTPAEAAPGSPVVTETLFTQLFEKIGDNPRTPFRMATTDQLGNYSGPSATIEVDVHLEGAQLDLTAPKVLEAKELNGTRLNFEKDFYDAPHATVQVDYIGSAKGQTVKVYWLGRATTYGSETQTVAYAGEKLEFLIHRSEVIDCIGTKAQINYTVELPNDPQIHPSKDLDITVTAQKHHLPEPTINGSKTNLRVYYPTLEARYTVRISLRVGNTRYDSIEYDITQPSQTDVAIPPAWISNNQGKQGLFNYTLKRTGTAEPLIFSWYLRVIL